jgi:hypothetical protein
VHRLNRRFLVPADRTQLRVVCRSASGQLPCGALPMFVHERALCESEFVGEGTRIWAFAHAMRGHAWIDTPPTIAQNVRIVEAHRHFQTVLDVAPSSPGAKAHMALAEEI